LTTHLIDSYTSFPPSFSQIFIINSTLKKGEEEEEQVSKHQSTVSNRLKDLPRQWRIFLPFPFHRIMVSRKRARSETEPASDQQKQSTAPGLLERLRNCWEFACVMQYIFTFGKIMKIDDDFGVEVSQAVVFAMTFIHSSIGGKAVTKDTTSLSH
jgi:hypothetical protein